MRATGDLDADIAALVARERARQDEKWGEQNHPDGTGPGTIPLARIDHLLTLGGNYPAARVAPPADALAQCAKHATDNAAQLGGVTWRDILLEEVFEGLAEDDVDRLGGELIQIAAVAQQWAAAIIRRGTR